MKLLNLIFNKKKMVLPQFWMIFVPIFSSWVNEEEVKLRETPGKDGRILYYLSRGTPVNVIIEWVLNEWEDSATLWKKVRVTTVGFEKEGWIEADLFEKGGDTYSPSIDTKYYFPGFFS